MQRVLSERRAGVKGLRERRINFFRLREEVEKGVTGKEKSGGLLGGNEKKSPRREASFSQEKKVSRQGDPIDQKMKT